MVSSYDDESSTTRGGATPGSEPSSGLGPVGIEVLLSLDPVDRSALMSAAPRCWDQVSEVAALAALRWYACSTCGDRFAVPTSVTPPTCPSGHTDPGALDDLPAERRTVRLAGDAVRRWLDQQPLEHIVRDRLRHAHQIEADEETTASIAAAVRSTMAAWPSSALDGLRRRGDGTTFDGTAQAIDDVLKITRTEDALPQERAP